ncbi:MAG: hypothetical protein LBQ66_15225 [Planctomycetaceae bacterium]|nr:hypothetical protein [Planctomycetaceae bacterium]
MANVLQHVLAFLPNLFGFLMHRGGRDARVPVLRRFAAEEKIPRSGKGLERGRPALVIPHIFFLYFFLYFVIL